MDILGIGAGVEASALLYFNAARRSGKTSRLIEALKSGDRVVCRGDGERRHMVNALRRRGIYDVEVISVPPDKPSWLAERHRPSEGRTLFDDDWLQDFYMQEIRSAARGLERLSAVSSGGYRDEAPYAVDTYTVANK